MLGRCSASEASAGPFVTGLIATALLLLAGSPTAIAQRIQPSDPESAGRDRMSAEAQRMLQADLRFGPFHLRPSLGLRTGWETLAERDGEDGIRGQFVANVTPLDLGGPVLFRQRRPGLDGEPFVLYKFRTMTDAVDERGELLADERRLTGLGRRLRRTSLDELPELLNVIRGEMSLVGPRPLLMSYLPRYDERQARRHEVRPGITGWAQVNGRNAVAWEEKLEMDVWYVDRVGPLVDLRILARTTLQVLRGEGISATGHATMPEFKGRET